MDPKFHPAVAAITSGNVDRLRSLLKDDPTLATAVSSCSHPTLLQCLVLDAADLPNKIEMGQVLIDAGAEINGPLVAAACIDNVESAAALLDAGAQLNGVDGWSPLEEALYWSNHRVIDLLIERGASLHNLRIAAGLGRVDLIKGFFNPDGSLNPEAGKVDWPFREPCKILKQPTAAEAAHRQNIINNAFVYACAHGRIDAAKLLLEKGAEINAIPPGFDYAGTGLHYAACQGQRAMVDFLLDHGADPDVKDQKVNATPASWAEHFGHVELSEYLTKRSSSSAAN